MPLTYFSNLPLFTGGAVSSLISRGGVKWLAAVAALAALTLLTAALFALSAAAQENPDLLSFP